MKTKLFVLFVLIAHFSIGQEYQLAAENSTELVIDGTSTLHGWTATAAQVDGVPTSVNVTEGTVHIDPFSIETKVISLDGGRGPAMNGKIQKALKADSDPTVIFNIQESLAISLSDISEDGFPVKGSLSIGGITHDVEIVTTITQKDKTLMISGKRDMKMSEFDIEAPSAMFGQIKTNDDITIRFNIKYITN